MDQPRSMRPTPRTPAAIEAELRRRLRLELKQARETADGELDEATLAAVIARAIAAALAWHLEAPEHTRFATQTSRGWRSAPGPRGAPGPNPPEQPPYAERGPRQWGPRGNRPTPQSRGSRPTGGGFSRGPKKRFPR